LRATARIGPSRCCLFAHQELAAAVEVLRQGLAAVTEPSQRQLLTPARVCPRPATHRGLPLPHGRTHIHSRSPSSSYVMSVFRATAERERALPQRLAQSAQRFRADTSASEPLLHNVDLQVRQARCEQNMTHVSRTPLLHVRRGTAESDATGLPSGWPTPSHRTTASAMPARRPSATAAWLPEQHRASCCGLDYECPDGAGQTGAKVAHLTRSGRSMGMAAASTQCESFGSALCGQRKALLVAWLPVSRPAADPPLRRSTPQGLQPKRRHAR
jgi:hypothetical protein